MQLTQQYMNRTRDRALLWYTLYTCVHHYSLCHSKTQICIPLRALMSIPGRADADRICDVAQCMVWPTPGVCFHSWAQWACLKPRPCAPCFRTRATRSRPSSRRSPGRTRLMRRWPLPGTACAAARNEWCLCLCSALQGPVLVLQTPSPIQLSSVNTFVSRQFSVNGMRLLLPVTLPVMNTTL